MELRRTTSLALSAAIAGIIAGAAFTTAGCSSESKAATAEKNGCKGPNGCSGGEAKEKNSCKGANGCKGAETKDKNSCSGPNGCAGKEKPKQ